MTHPTIHLNGTSRNELLVAWESAYDALEVAYKALKETAPNGRDYYLQGDGAYSDAIDEHRARLGLIEQVQNELGELIAKAKEK